MFLAQPNTLKDLFQRSTNFSSEVKAKRVSVAKPGHLWEPSISLHLTNLSAKWWLVGPDIHVSLLPDAETRNKYETDGGH